MATMIEFEKTIASGIHMLAVGLHDNVYGHNELGDGFDEKKSIQKYRYTLFLVGVSTR